MDWTVFWFMLPVCLVIATVAMFSGISGAALLTPVFLIVFPLIGVPRLGTVAAIGTSLLLETSGFGTGLYRYIKMRLVDFRTAGRLIALTVPLAVVGAVVSRHVPVQALKLGYGMAMIGLAALLLRDTSGPELAGEGAPGAPAANRRGVEERPSVGPGAPEPAPAIVGESDHPHASCSIGEHRHLTAASGKVYDFCAHGLGLQRILSGAGAFVAGMISTGVGEATLPLLVQRSRFPVAVAAATSTVVVAGTVAGAATTHLIQLVGEGGLAAIPWNLIVWAVPGSVGGAFVGTRLQGRISEKASRLFFSGLFAAIGLTFLLAFTVFSQTFR